MKFIVESLDLFGFGLHDVVLFRQEFEKVVLVGAGGELEAVLEGLDFDLELEDLVFFFVCVVVIFVVDVVVVNVS